MGHTIKMVQGTMCYLHTKQRYGGKGYKIRIFYLKNEAEYKALLFTLWTTFKMGATYVQLFTNSIPVSNQFRGSFETNNDMMEVYLDILSNCTQQFKSLCNNKPRSEIKHADALAIFVNTITH